VTQLQNNNVPNPPYTGVVGTVNQDSTAKSTAVVTQNETQCQDWVNVPVAPSTCPVTPEQTPPPGVTLHQTQYGPLRVLTPSASNSGPVHFHTKGYGKSAQTNAGSGVHDVFQLQQNSTQSSDPGGQQFNVVQGDCASSGNNSATGGSCQAGETVNQNNGGGTQAGWTAPNIPDVHINCGSQTCSATPPPAPTNVTGPTSPNFSSSAAFNWDEAATGVSFVCSIDGGTPVSCQQTVAFSQGYGAHHFQVATTDGHGHTSAFVPAAPGLAFTNVPPTPGIDSGPANGSSTNSTSATFTFDDSDTSLSFVCSQDGVTYTACSPTAGPGSGEQDYTGLAYGTQNFYVEATDGSGHFSSPETVQWTIVPPMPVIDTSSTDSPTPGDAKFTFHDSDTSLSFVCSLDGLTYTACSPTPGPGPGAQNYSGLAGGTYTFYVEATDGSGNFSLPATFGPWTTSGT
jgi:hypothetical protein